MWGRALRVSILPAMLTAAIAATIAGGRAGLPPIVFFAGAGLCAMIAIAAFEHVLPASRAWQARDADFSADLCHLAVTGGLVETLPALMLGSPLAGAWPVAPWPLQAALAFVVTDFLSYWTHRLLHGPLWRVHEVHHAATRLWWVNSWRVHPVEGLVYFCTTAVPLALLGAPAEALLVVWSTTTVFRIIQHSNVDVRLGPLNRIFAGPEVHRWHHAIAASEHHANFGTTLAVWDLLFGTLRLHRFQPARLGVEGTREFPHRYLDQLAAPFRARPERDEGDGARAGE